MKRKVMAILLMCLLVILTGCNTTQVSYWEKTKESADWKAMDFKQSGKVTVDYLGDKIEVNYTAGGYGQNAGLNTYVEMDAEVMVPASLTGSKAIKETIEVEAYMIEGKTYINKEYFETIFKLTGEDVPKAFKQIDAKYIGIKESNDQVEEILKTMGLDKGEKVAYDSQAAIVFYEELVKLIALDIPITKEGNTYYMTLDSEALGNQVKKTLDKGVENIVPLNTLLGDIFIQAGATQADFKTLQSQYAVEKSTIHTEIDKYMGMINPEIEVATTFGKDQQQEKITVTASMPEILDFKMSINQDYKKAEVKELKMPGKAVELSQEQLINLLMPKRLRIEEEKGMLVKEDSMTSPLKVINKNGQKYVPARTVLTELGIQIGYDKAKGYSYGVFNGKQVKINDFTKEGVTYVALSTLQKAGVEVVISGSYGNTTILLSY